MLSWKPSTAMTGEIRSVEDEVAAWREFETARFRMCEAEVSQDQKAVLQAMERLREARKQLFRITNGRWPLPAVGVMPGGLET